MRKVPDELRNARRTGRSLRVIRADAARALLAGAVVALLAFASYYGNVFRAADNHWFAVFSADSEQLVLDGLLHAQPGESVVPGHYLRTGISAQATHLENFERANRSGEFERYRSQFGLQAKAFGVLRHAGLTEAWQFHALTASAMALVVAALFFFLRRDFGWRVAVPVAAVLVLSPWMIVFARNLYWVAFTWFVPLLLAMIMAPRVYRSGPALVVFLGSSFIAYLVKFLCGYEYITSIFLAACVPLIYEGLRQQILLLVMLRLVILHGLACLLALLLAFALHANALPIENGQNGFQQIVVTAEKRLASGNPALTAKQVCEGDAACEQVMQASLQSNPLAVLGKYLLVPDVLPWAGSVRDLDGDGKQAIRQFLRQPGHASFLALHTRLGTETLVSLFVSRVVSPLCFLLFAVWAFRCAWCNGRVQAITLIAAFAAPVSWFVLAKGHSYIHTHLNYVLWYVPFVMYALTFCFSRAMPRSPAAAARNRPAPDSAR